MHRIYNFPTVLRTNTSLSDDIPTQYGLLYKRALDGKRSRTKTPPYPTYVSNIVAVTSLQSHVVLRSRRPEAECKQTEPREPQTPH